MKKMFDSANFDITNFLPEIVFDENKKPLEMDEEDPSNDYYFYSHSRINNEMCFSDSSKYITSLMRLPWQLNLHNNTFQEMTIRLMTHVSFDPTAWAIRLHSGAYFFLDNFRFSQKNENSIEC